MKDVKVTTLVLVRGKITPHKIRFEMDTNNFMSVSCYVTKEFDKEMGSPNKLVVHVSRVED